MSLPPSSRGGNEVRIRPDPGQFWAGAAATVIVAALVALVGILICRWTLGIPILAPSTDGAWGNAHTGEYVLGAACAALAGAALLYLLSLGAPQPGVFFGWIIGLVTLAAVVYPFSTSAPLQQKAATAVVNLVLGVAIGTLLTAVAARAMRRYVRRPAGQPYERDRYDQRSADPYERDPYDRRSADPYERDPYNRRSADPNERDRYDHPPTQPMDYRPSRTTGD